MTNKVQRLGFKRILLVLVLSMIELLLIERVKEFKLFEASWELIKIEPPKNKKSVIEFKVKDLRNILSPEVLIRQGFFMIPALNFIIQIILPFKKTATLNSWKKKIPIILLYIGIFYLFVQPTAAETGFIKEEILSSYTPA